MNHQRCMVLMTALTQFIDNQPEEWQDEPDEYMTPERRAEVKLAQEMLDELTVAHLAAHGLL